MRACWLKLVAHKFSTTDACLPVTTSMWSKSVKIFMETLFFFIFNMIKCDSATWLARQKVDQSNPQSVWALSVDLPLFQALPLDVALWQSKIMCCPRKNHYSPYPRELFGLHSPPPNHPWQKFQFCQVHAFLSKFWHFKSSTPLEFEWLSWAGYGYFKEYCK